MCWGWMIASLGVFGTWERLPCLLGSPKPFEGSSKNFMASQAIPPPRNMGLIAGLIKFIKGNQWFSKAALIIRPAISGGGVH